AEWGIKRPDLRAIGADLAVRAAKEEGKISNAGQESAVRETALRHGPPQATLQSSRQSEASPCQTCKPEPDLEPPKVKSERKSAEVYTSERPIDGHVRQARGRAPRGADGSLRPS